MLLKDFVPALLEKKLIKQKKNTSQRERERGTKRETKRYLEREVRT
jgi:hypothetical protein